MIKKCEYCQRARIMVDEFIEAASKTNEFQNQELIRGEVKVKCVHCHDGWNLDEEGEILANLIARKLGL